MTFHKSCLLQTLKKKQDELFNTDITEFTGKHWLSPDGRISEEASFHSNQ